MTHFRPDCGWRWRYILNLPGDSIESVEFSTRASSVDNLRINRIRKDVAAFTGANRMPIAKRDLSVIAATDHGGRAAVLLRAIDPIRKLIVDCNVIKLRSRLVV